LAWDEDRLSLANLQRFEQALVARGCLKSICAFVDGTVLPVARPGKDHKVWDQEELYNGSKHLHCITFQGIATPDGLISSLCGPYEGKAGDFLMLRESKTVERLEALMKHLPESQHLYIFGDKAYHSGAFGVMGAYQTPAKRSLTARDEGFNFQMSKHRIAVEHAFGKVKGQWGMLNRKNALTTGSQPVAAYLAVAALLPNAHSCPTRKNQIPDRHEVFPRPCTNILP
jgi:hypothetical protein